HIGEVRMILQRVHDRQFGGAGIAEQMRDALVLQQREKGRAPGDAIHHVSSCPRARRPSWDDAIMADLERAKQSSAPSWLPCVAGRGAFDGRSRHSPHLTAYAIYVINRLHIMSRIEAKTDVFRAIADP